ncbi:MAG: RNA polymerase sigma factor [Phycisphaerae bacterium]
MSTCDAGTELLKQAVAGDVAALTEILCAARPRLCTYIAVRIPHAARDLIDAEDIVQQALIHVFRLIDRFEPRGERAFERWLRVIALSELRTVLRMRNCAKRGGGWARVHTADVEESATCLLHLIQTSDLTPSGAVGIQESVLSLQAALARLSADQRAVIELVYLEGTSTAEVARILGRTERAIYNLCDRAKARIAAMMGSRSRHL